MNYNELILQLATDTVTNMIRGTEDIATLNLITVSTIALATGLAAETILTEVNSLVERTLNLGG